MQVIIAVTLKPGIKYLLDTNGAICLLEKNDSNQILVKIDIDNSSIREITKDFVAFLLIDSIYNLKDIERFDIVSPKIY